MKAPRKEHTRPILRAFGTDRLNRIADESINVGRSLKGLTKTDREYCCMVLHAASHAGEMTLGERKAYHEALAAYRARLARRKDGAA